jgi:hypothetical protein
VAFTTPFVIRLIRTIGVPPIASRMLSKTFFSVIVDMARLDSDRSTTDRRRAVARLAARGLAAGLVGAAVAGTIAARGPRGRGAEQPARTGAAEARAVAYLAREVPAWRREHPCYSCHNNGDAARALVAALARKHDVRAALDDTLTWLGNPAGWSANGGGKGGADDKRLARIQFAHATSAAATRGLVPPAAIGAAAAIVAADQQADGSWRLDSSDSIGSPATYGTALATLFASRTLAGSSAPRMRDAAERAERWLRTVPAHNVPDAAAIVLAFSGAADQPPPENWRAALTLLRQGQGREGGWGPYATSPAEAFDTALAVLALQGLTERSARAEPVFTRDTLDEAVARGRAYLLAQQLGDGSWVETTRPSGQTSYAQRISTTAWVLLALFETSR